MFDSAFDVVIMVVEVPRPVYAIVLPSTLFVTESVGESPDLSVLSLESGTGVIVVPAPGDALLLPSTLMTTGGAMDSPGLFESAFDVVNRVVRVPVPEYGVGLPFNLRPTERVVESLGLFDSSFDSVGTEKGVPTLGKAVVLPSALSITGVGTEFGGWTSSDLEDNSYPGGTPPEDFGKFGKLVTKTEGIVMKPPPYALPSNAGVQTGMTLEVLKNGPMLVETRLLPA